MARGDCWAGRRATGWVRGDWAGLQPTGPLIESLQQRFPDLKLFNAAKLFSPVCFSTDLTLLHRNARIWLQSFIDHFCTNGENLFDERGLKLEL